MTTRRITALGTAALAAVAATTGCGVHCRDEFGGYPWGEMPDLDMLVGDTVRTEVLRHLSPERCPAHMAHYLPESSDSAAVAVSVASPGDSILTTVALAATDSVLVTVWGLNWNLNPDARHDPLNFHEFVVRVADR